MITRISIAVAVSLGVGLMFLLTLTVWMVWGYSTNCDHQLDCDAFAAVCASYHNEHQFFYNQCDMLRENCLTGKFWKRDHFTHCNVYV